MHEESLHGIRNHGISHFKQFDSRIVELLKVSPMMSDPSSNCKQPFETYVTIKKIAQMSITMGETFLNRIVVLGMWRERDEHDMLYMNNFADDVSTESIENAVFEHDDALVLRIRVHPWELKDRMK